MAIQARWYPDNLTFPFITDDGCHVVTNPSQDLIENACCLNDFSPFNLQQQQYQQSQPPPQYQDSCFHNGFNKLTSIHSSSMATNIQKQNQEIEGFISLQNERLRLALHAHRKEQLLTILKTYESKSEQLFKQKDYEIEQATKRRIQLEEFLRRTDIERQKWQLAANETEAMVINLNNTIKQVSHEKMKQQDAEDEGSCCHENGENKNMKMMSCRSCFNEDSCVVMLPCRHLCSCESCDVFLHSCPVCKTVKKASIQVSLFDSTL